MDLSILNWIVLISFLVLCINAITLEDIHIPSEVMKGEPVWLNCTFDLQGDELYSIKWYKNSVEFYRYLPKADPPGPQGFLCDGIYLDLSKSTLGNVFLNTTDLNSEGDYKCEVSAEGPSFKTVRKAQALRVYSNGSSPMIIKSFHLWNGLLTIIIIILTTVNPFNGLRTSSLGI